MEISGLKLVVVVLLKWTINTSTWTEGIAKSWSLKEGLNHISSLNGTYKKISRMGQGWRKDLETSWHLEIFMLCHNCYVLLWTLVKKKCFPGVFVLVVLGMNPHLFLFFYINFVLFPSNSSSDRLPFQQQKVFKAAEKLYRILM